MEARHPVVTSLPVLFLLGFAAACGPEAPPPVAPSPVPSASASAAPVSAAEAPAGAAKPKFENPGGMWMPEQLPAQAQTLKSLGLEIDPQSLATPTSDVLQSVVSLGGCSASFVSPEGLIATNHHCAIGALQFNATPKDNILDNGFLAKTRADEKWNGPTSKVYVTQAITDVTKDVRDGLDAIKDNVARARKIEERTKALVAGCEKGRPGIRCSTAEYFGGAQYRLIEQLEIRDVRLVFAPHEAVGDFGGEVDNWHWPRHTGDISMFRAYVGKDGKPADYSPDNVPYKPPHHLKLASKPLKQGDLVLIAGYPGRTNRLKTASETEEAVSFVYPRMNAYMEQNLAVLQALADSSPELKIKATPTMRGLHNYITKNQGIVEGLVKGGLEGEKAKGEARLKEWVNAEPGRKAAYGDVLDKLAALSAESKKTREADAELAELARVPLLSSATTIVRMAEERPKADAARDPAYQERNWKRLEGTEREKQSRFDPAIDKALLKLALKRAAKVPAKERSAYVAIIVGAGEPTDAKIDAAVDALYKATKLGDLEGRVGLVKSAKLEDVQKSKDPLLQVAVKLRPLQKAAKEREEGYEGAMALLRPRYIDLLEKSSTSPIAPDANGTLRVTYGTVRGYAPNAESAPYEPFTVVSQMVKKNTGKEPFNAPDAVLGAAKAKNFGAYADKDLGELPVDFLSDLDITNGNSGSATLNGRGELVGLAFDGNYESMASDWLFQPKITRTIHVDFRYVLWLLDGVYGGDHIVKEMGGTPSVQ